MSVDHVLFVGDSGLDNIIWEFPLEEQEDWKESSERIAYGMAESIEGRLRKKGDSGVPKYEVVNLAYDGFTTESVLRGAKVGGVLRSHPALNDYLKAKKVDRMKIVYPLQELKKAVEAKPDATHYVVISVGGNDFRGLILALKGLFLGISEVQKRYLEIVKTVSNLKGRVFPIIITQYRPEINFRVMYTKSSSVSIYSILNKVARVANLIPKVLWKNSPITEEISTLIAAGKDVSIPFLGALMEQFYLPILEYAKENKIPVLDMSNTFDPTYDQKLEKEQSSKGLEFSDLDFKKLLYNNWIEPGYFGTTQIVDGIDQIIRNHNFGGKSKIYSKKLSDESYSSTDNEPAEWRVS